MPKTAFHDEFSNIGPTRRTWTWRIKVNVLINNIVVNKHILVSFL